MPLWYLYCAWRVHDNTSHAGGYPHIQDNGPHTATYPGPSHQQGHNTPGSYASNPPSPKLGEDLPGVLDVVGGGGSFRAEERLLLGARLRGRQPASPIAYEWPTQHDVSSLMMVHGFALLQDE